MPADRGHGAVIADVASDVDLIGFEQYVRPIVDVLTSSQQALTLGIHGKWGCGKSTLVNLVLKKLPQRQFHVVHFNPWLFRREDDLFIPLVESIRRSLSSKMAESASRIGEVLGRLALGGALRLMTLNTLTVEKLGDVEKEVVDLRNRSVCATFEIRQELSGLVEKIRPKKIVLVIDDLDRCTPDELVAVLEDVKLFLTINHLIVILVVDDALVRYSVARKYPEFQFEDRSSVQLASDYLQKFIQIPFNVRPLSHDERLGFVRRMELTEEVSSVCLRLGVALPGNPRQLIRFLNSVTLSRNVAHQVPAETVARMHLVRISFPRLWSWIDRYPRLIIDCERHVTGTDMTWPEDVYGDARGLIEPTFSACRKMPEFAEVFRSSSFRSLSPMQLSDLLRIGSQQN